MSENSDTSLWHVSKPSAWPGAPPWMSFSTLSDLEACPRRWALSAAEYPNVWKRHGYPRAPQPATLEGTVVHLSLQTIAGALVERGCPSLLDESAVSTLRELGGFSAVILRSVDRALQQYEGNPRATPVLGVIRDRLVARVPEFRSRVQGLLSRIHLVSCDSRWDIPGTNPEGKCRFQLKRGSYSEVELRAPDLAWIGVADLLTLSTACCEIRDFKTGAAKQEHEFQLHVYALLWARDHDLNPSGRIADKLVISYDDGDVVASGLDENALESLENELRNRTSAAFAALKVDPPEARPSPENCSYCAVRHLCEKYWHWNARQGGSSESLKGRFADLQIKLSGRHGPSSWDGVIETPSDLKVGRPFLLRTENLRFDLHPGQRLRLLNVHNNMTNEELGEEERLPIVATMGVSTEAFVIPE